MTKDGSFEDRRDTIRPRNRPHDAYERVAPAHGYPPSWRFYQLLLLADIQGVLTCRAPSCPCRSRSLKTTCVSSPLSSTCRATPRRQRRIHCQSPTTRLQAVEAEGYCLSDLFNALELSTLTVTPEIARRPSALDWILECQPLRLPPKYSFCMCLPPVELCSTFVAGLSVRVRPCQQHSTGVRSRLLSPAPSTPWATSTVHWRPSHIRSRPHSQPATEKLGNSIHGASLSSRHDMMGVGRADSIYGQYFLAALRSRGRSSLDSGSRTYQCVPRQCMNGCGRTRRAFGTRSSKCVPLRAILGPQKLTWPKVVPSLRGLQRSRRPQRLSRTVTSVRYETRMAFEVRGLLTLKFD